MSEEEQPEKGLEENSARRSSSDLASSGRSSASIGANLAAEQSPPRLDPTTQEVAVVPEEEAVAEEIVWDPSVFSETEDDSIFSGRADTSPDVRWVRHRPPLGPLPRWGIVAFVVFSSLGFAYRKVDNWVNSLVSPQALPGEEIDFVIEPGWSANEVAVNLGSVDIIDDSAMFRQWMRCHPTLAWFIDCPADVEYSFQAGDYVLQEHMGFQGVVDALNEGPIPPEVIRVTIPEGLTISQTITRLKERMPTYSEEQLQEAFVSDVVRWEHYPEEFNLPYYEGMFFPDTYQLDDATLTNELSLVTRMHNQFLNVVAELDFEARAAEVGLTPYEALIVASLIEEEALLNLDRGKISQVIHNRLDQGWSLGLESTVRYAAGKTAGQDLVSADLSSDSPWNTWIEPGLPITPISAPGRSSLEAAVNPEDGPWMFFVRTDENDVLGAHTFAVTGEEFAAAVEICRAKDLGCG
ncbi:MAG TPA: endolytic transglycosylase MltG [Acidimicrobiia bacterium]|nr:endolytic transglycosylase MltG [Acidimicrobiia bacterium]HIL46720.1 endolytic transglycosylase MltG [Acidimicrobiia bacterium]